MKHKHCELIKQWADGAEIQRFSMTVSGWQWVDDPNPQWIKVDDYRIKPEEKNPVVRWLWAIPTTESNGWRLEIASEEEMEDTGYIGVIKLEGSRTEFPE